MIKISLPDKIGLLWGLFWFVFLMKALECLLPTPHGDALYYHLVAPKIWSVSSWSEMLLDLSHYVQAGYFDLIYFIPFSLSDSLMKNQIAGQFLHFFFSIGLASLLCLFCMCVQSFCVSGLSVCVRPVSVSGRCMCPIY